MIGNQADGVGRNLVLCFDGTNNQYAATNTNVVKLYAMLDRNRVDQLCYYQTGIGTFAPVGVWGNAKQFLAKLVDSATAWMLESHVTAGYRFLMRYYEEGDQIFIFGFSRGAYTARALAAMLHKVGLLTRGNEELIPFAWRIYKRERDGKVYRGFRRTFSRRVRVRLLGLWDTVSSVGWMWNPSFLQFTANNESVDAVRHAVALDEKRAYFVQNLWGEQYGADVKQVWFAGVHCDVGGGYQEHEAGLSKISLKWMAEEAQHAGVHFQPKVVAAMLPRKATASSAAADPEATIHESLRNLWWIVEFIPKRYRDPAAQFAERWMLHRARPRFVAEGANIHSSVLARIKKVSSYRPRNLPASYSVVQ